MLYFTGFIDRQDLLQHQIDHLSHSSTRLYILPSVCRFLTIYSAISPPILPKRMEGGEDGWTPIDLEVSAHSPASDYSP